MQPDPQNQDILLTLFALFGGIARELQNYLEKREITWRTVFARALVAAFCGVLFSHTVGYWFPDMTGVASGLGGWLGPEAMKFIMEVIRNRIYVKKD